MSEGGLTHHRQEFERRDLFLHALLGLASHGQALQRWLDAAVRAPASDESLDAVGEQLLDVLMGCVAVHAQLRHQFLEGAAPDTARSAAEEPIQWTRSLTR